MYTLLQAAVESGCPETVKILLQHKANINECDESGGENPQHPGSLLHRAIQIHDVKTASLMISLLLANGMCNIHYKYLSAN